MYKLNLGQNNNSMSVNNIHDKTLGNFNEDDSSFSEIGFIDWLTN